MTIETSVWVSPIRRGRRGERRAVSVPVTAVLGAGHGGLALAAYLAARGVPVRLWNRSPAPLAAVRAEGGVWLTLPDGEQRHVELGHLSCDLGDALRGAEAVLVALPAVAHAQVARAAAPHLQPGQAVLLLPGRTGGALEFAHQLVLAGNTAPVLIGEAQTFPFASRVLGPARVAIYGIKREVRVAALPAVRTRELLALFRPLLPMLRVAPSVLHTSLENMGAVLHPTIALLNAGRVEAGPPFRFYADGVTPSVANVLEALDAERLAVAEAYGARVRSLRQWLADSYGWSASSLRAAVAGNPAYRRIAAPEALEHRYLYEDVPTGLVPLAELGRLAGVLTNLLRALVDLAGAVHGRDYWASGRNLGRMGIADLNPAEIVDVVMEGGVSRCVSA